MEQDKLKKEKEYKANLFFVLIIMTILGLFIYGSSFRVWGKKFVELPNLVIYGFFLIILLMVIEIILFGVYLSVNKKYITLKTTTKKQYGIFIVIMTLLFTIIQILSLPWVTKVKIGEKGKYQLIQLEDRPIWNPPQKLIFLNKELDAHPKIDLERLIKHISLPIILIIISILKLRKIKETDS